MNLIEQTYDYLTKMMDYVFENNEDISNYKAEIIKAAETAEIPTEHLVEALLFHWYDLVERALADDILTRNEETTLASIIEAFPFTETDVNRHNCLERLTKAATLRDLMNGEVKSRMNHSGVIPFKLQKNESLLWVFKDVEYDQFVSNRTMAGGSSGLSIKVAKGVYWRVGGFAAKPVVKTDLKNLDKGNLFLTNKHIMFDGGFKNFKIRLSSLALVEPYGDGLQLQKNTQTAMPLFLHPIDGWFCYNVIQNA